MDVTRKTFLIQLAQLAGGGWMLSGCGGGGYAGTPPAPTGCSATIAANHGHVLTIPAADLDSPVYKSYDIRGAALDHTHSVTFTVAMLASLKAGNAVNTTSGGATSDGHTHAISERCS